MSIHTGVLYQKSVPTFHPDAYVEMRLALLNFLAPFGWTEAARVGNWGSYLGDATTVGIVLSHPRWGCIYWGSNVGAGTALKFGISSSSGDIRILKSTLIAWDNINTPGSIGPAVTYIEHDDYVMLKIGTAMGGGAMAGDMFFVSTGSYQFIDDRAFNSSLEQSEYFCPTTRYTSSVAENSQIGLEKKLLRKFKGDSTGLLTTERLPGLVTYSYGAVLPLGEYLINGKRYYQFSTGLYVLAEIET